MDAEKKICWLFCRVIDNYGDAGVCLRLAGCLAEELGWEVHLWIDDAATLRPLCPALPPMLPCFFENIHVYQWTDDFVYSSGDIPPPHIAIEAFACDLPGEAVEIIRQNHSLWLNWEYLSAEDGHERLHTVPSLLGDGLKKYFWFMGFGEKSGGLIRERDYGRLSTVCHPAFRKQLGLPEKTSPEWLLFGYGGGIWADWLDMWRRTGRPITLLLSGGQIIHSLKGERVIPDDALAADGSIFQTACVRLVRIPFVAQHDFDRLLYLSDGLIVRGEDSFVRAQFSGKPFFWHIYPQDEKAHEAKLHAFWDKAGVFYPNDVREAHRLLSDDLNGICGLNPEKRLEAWQTLTQQSDGWRAGTGAWRDFLFRQTSALERLAKFVSDTLK